MSQITEHAEKSVQHLRSAIARSDDTLIDKAILGVEEALLNKRVYEKIGDERLLAEALSLLSGLYGKELQGKLDGLCQHLELMRAVHDKFFAVLNADVGLDDLLYLHLLEWPHLDQPIMHRFTDQAKRELQNTRCGRDPNVVIEEFTKQFLHILDTAGLKEAVDALSPYIELGLEGYRRNTQWTVHALFASGTAGEVHGIKIHATHGNGNIQALDEIDLDMQKAARRAMQYAKSQWPSIKQWDLTWDIARDDIAFGGESIGLALTVGILAVTESTNVDPYTGFTGHVEWDTGEVKQIGHLDAKLKAAAHYGVRRVFIPHDNHNDVNADYAGLKIVAISSVEETKTHLESRNFDSADTPLDRLAEVKIREMEIELKHMGIIKRKQEQREKWCKRAIFTNWRDEVPVDIYHSKNLKAVVSGKDSPLKEQIQRITSQVFGQGLPSKPSTGSTKELRAKYTVSDPIFQQRIKTYVLGRDDAIEEQEQNCLYRAKVVGHGQAVYVRQYSSGTITVSGLDPLFSVINEGIHGLLGIEVSSSVDNNDSRERAQVKAVEAVVVGDQWIGTDESGKGDYFGPLVGAAVLVDRSIANILDELGVRDSKKLSDKRNQELAHQIRQLCGDRAQVVVIPPERYNALYDQLKNEGKNLNTLLAWAHARAIENILSTFPQDEITVIVDKFADESYIQSKLLEKGRRTNLNLVQLPKAEANVAVAAASILARAQFLNWLERLSSQYGVRIPKGASDPRIPEVGSLIIRKHSRSELAKAAKLHFRTTERILGNK